MTPSPWKKSWSCLSWEILFCITSCRVPGHQNIWGTTRASLPQNWQRLFRSLMVQWQKVHSCSMIAVSTSQLQMLLPALTKLSSANVMTPSWSVHSALNGKVDFARGLVSAVLATFPKEAFVQRWENAAVCVLSQLSGGECPRVLWCKIYTKCTFLLFGTYTTCRLWSIPGRQFTHICNVLYVRYWCRM